MKSTELKSLLHNIPTSKRSEVTKQRGIGKNLVLFIIVTIIIIIWGWCYYRLLVPYHNNFTNGTSSPSEFIHNLGYKTIKKSIPTVDAAQFSYNEFYEDYYLQNQPLLVKNASVLIFNNVKKWTSSWILSQPDAETEKLDFSCHTGRLVIKDCSKTMGECANSEGRCVLFNPGLDFRKIEDRIEIKGENSKTWRAELMRGMKTSFAFPDVTFKMFILEYQCDIFSHPRALMFFFVFF